MRIDFLNDEWKARDVDTLLGEEVESVVIQDEGAGVCFNCKSGRKVFMAHVDD
jgi:hypothetical protein